MKTLILTLVLVVVFALEMFAGPIPSPLYEEGLKAAVQVGSVSLNGMGLKNHGINLEGQLAIQNRKKKSCPQL